MISFSGMYNKTLFRNEKNGNTIFAFNSKDCNEYKDDQGNIICYGKIPVYTSGIPLKIEGKVEKSSKGYKIAVSKIEESINDEDIAVKFLSTDIFKGIGEKTARKIVNYTGPDIFNFIKMDNSKALLIENVKELDSDKVDNLFSIIQNSMTQRTVFDYICRFGCSYSQAETIANKFGIKSIQLLKDNPYKVGSKGDIPFIICDAMAKAEGFCPYDEKRIRALSFEALNYLSFQGDTYATLDSIARVANRIVKDSAFTENIPVTLLASTIYNTPSFILEYTNNSTRVYTKNSWDAENKIVEELNRLKNSSTALPYTDDILSLIEKEMSICYSSSQKKCFNFLRSSGIKIVTGGPGTGKTTVVNGLIKAYKKMFPNNIITLCAPTGRAAQRMSESTSLPASTIHRLLDVKPFGETLSFKDNSDPLSSDFIIVDEVSMVDSELFSMLLGAIKNNTLVVLCGDIDQLPSVGAGNVLSDMICSNAFEVNTLDVIFRQGKDSNIIYNANEIKNGSASLKRADDFSIIVCKDEYLMQDKIMELTQSYYDSENPFDFQILCSTKKGDVGTLKLNSLIQSLYTSANNEVVYGTGKFRVNDKIMMMTNNYEIGYLNGDIGIVTYIDEKGIEVKINEEPIFIENKLLKDVSLAFASTIHKSQGAEYSVVVVSLPKNPSIMLTRNLLYTAITRAKKKVLIVTEPYSVTTSIKTLNTNKRKTALCEKIIKNIAY